jgi:predicted ATPase/class 3 adenylate cyclase
MADHVLVVAQPSETVTLLFTDIEGSTGLIDELGEDAWVQALGQHRRLLRGAFSAHRGVEVDTQGDAFLYAFTDPGDALAAASQGRVALGSGPVKVRMGLHTGRLLRTGEGYAGRELHRAARIAASGHGGQVVLSAATRALVDGDLVELGEHRLKDFDEPVVLFQLGREHFPPLKTISNTNLPRPASSFVGRAREREELVSLFRDGSRLVTLSGPGGSGKTRLGVEVASEIVSDFKAGVFWVGLAQLRDPSLVIETTARMLGAKGGLAEHISERELLLLLDNFEQVVEAAPALSQLLERCPNLKVLVTSRELLRVAGEVGYPVLPLTEPEALQLFCERSRLEPDETIAELCRRLDDLPLAVELAAARTRVLTPAQILDRLGQRLDLLKGGRDAAPRQQTLRATIEWSYELLREPERQLFARLAVFAGFTLDAAAEIAGADVDTLQSLVDKSLVRMTDGRFWMLETIRELARERFAASDESIGIGRGHAQWFLQLAEQAEPFLTGAEQSAWLQRLEDDHDNLRASLDWFFEHDESELALRLAGALWSFWFVHGHVSEARRWLRRALDVGPDEASEAHAKALIGAGYLASEQGDVDEALRLLRAGLACAKEVGDVVAAANAAAIYCGVLSDAPDGRADPRAALVAGEEAVAFARETGNDFVLAIALNNLGVATDALGDDEGTAAYMEESLAVRRRIGDVSRIALALCNVASKTLARGDISRAASMYAEAAETASAIGDKRNVSFALGGLAWVAYRNQEWQVADTHARESLRLARELGMKVHVAAPIFCLAGAAAATGDPARAARLAAAAELHHSLLTSSPVDANCQAVIESAKAACDPETWERASAEGRAMSLDEAAEQALSFD